MALPRIVLSCLTSPILAAVGPRLALIAFRFGQPLLVSRSIRFILGQTRNQDDLYARQGYWIVLATLAIYLGLAVRLSDSAIPCADADGCESSPPPSTGIR